MLNGLAADSIDAVVTDPPYGLSFMGKKWDYYVPSVELWREVLRVLKPGGHVLSFGGTRTYHRMVVNIEDAGFEIRDQLQWVYGSGFPKSLDISKAIDKAAGAEREVIGKVERAGSDGAGSTVHQSGGDKSGVSLITAPATDLAKQWQGWGTALKPANEPIVLARKPLIGTVAENVEKFGTGGLNIDGSRIGTSDKLSGSRNPSANTGNIYGVDKGGTYTQNPEGRWPANVLFDEDAAARLGEPSRFFYVAKASKRERNAGLEGFPLNESGIKNGSGRGFSESDPYKKILNQNHHPTVKPIKLMEYLIKLVTPPGGVVLDPFMGSGTTGIAAKNLGFGFVGIELSEEYFNIAQRRILS